MSRKPAPICTMVRWAVLRDVVDYYDKGGDYSPNKSELIKPLHLSEEEKRDLGRFLEFLTGARQ